VTQNIVKTIHFSTVIWYNEHKNGVDEHMKRIVVELSKERLITPSRLIFVGAILGNSDMVRSANEASVRNTRGRYLVLIPRIGIAQLDGLCL
jgi:hypothetical protein